MSANGQFPIGKTWWNGQRDFQVAPQPGGLQFACLFPPMAIENRILLCIGLQIVSRSRQKVDLCKKSGEMGRTVHLLDRNRFLRCVLELKFELWMVEFGSPNSTASLRLRRCKHFTFLYKFPLCTFAQSN